MSPIPLQTDLQYNRQRWYFAKVGRWISEDENSVTDDITNKYRYVHNSPMNASEPTGQWGEWLVDLVAPLGLGVTPIVGSVAIRGLPVGVGTASRPSGRGSEEAGAFLERLETGANLLWQGGVDLLTKGEINQQLASRVQTQAQAFGRGVKNGVLEGAHMVWDVGVVIGANIDQHLLGTDPREVQAKLNAKLTSQVFSNYARGVQRARAEGYNGKVGQAAVWEYFHKEGVSSAAQSVVQTALVVAMPQVGIPLALAYASAATLQSGSMESFGFALGNAAFSLGLRGTVHLAKRAAPHFRHYVSAVQTELRAGGFQANGFKAFVHALTRQAQKAAISKAIGQTNLSDRQLGRLAIMLDRRKSRTALRELERLGVDVDTPAVRQLIARNSRYADLRGERPRLSDAMVKKVWDSAKDANGRVFDPTTTPPTQLTWGPGSRHSQWHMGHVENRSYQQLHQQFMSGQISYKQFLGEVRNHANYFPQAPRPNMGRHRERGIN